MARKVTKKIPTTKINIDCIIRHYTYTAHVSSVTGKLIQITAGCRVWRSFDVAIAHYQNDEAAWSDKYIDNLSIGRPRWAQREEARCILRKLSSQVYLFALKLKQKKAKARKLARAAAKKK